MSVPRIYHPNPITEPTLTLTERATHHLKTVLRKKINDPLIVFTNEPHEWEAHIVALHHKTLIVQLDQVRAVHRESPLNLHLAPALCKGEKLDWMIQKAVELGVTDITPLVSTRALSLKSMQLAKKHEHWQGIIISAMEQCGRTQLPRLHAPCAFSTFIQQPPVGLGFILHPEANKSLRTYAAPSERACTLLIGPEGGWTDPEYQEALLHHYQPLKLGPRILRAETAPIALIAILQAMWGDLT